MCYILSIFEWVYCAVSGGCISGKDEYNLNGIVWFTMILIYVYQGLSCFP